MGEMLYFCGMENWIDIHTHCPGRGISVADRCLGEVVQPEGGQVFYSRGIHPLFIGDGVEGALEQVEREAAAGEIVAVGEAGLDRNGEAPLEVQTGIFERQVGIAARYGLPLVVHVVRAVPELISLRKKYPAFGKWIVHGFNSRREILHDLLRHGFYISVGAKALVEGTNVCRLLPEIPDDRLFLETDEGDVPIEEVYAAVALRKQVPVEELQRMVAVNFERLFSPLRINV